MLVGEVSLLKGHYFFSFFFVFLSIWKKTRYFLFMEVDDFR